MTKSISSLTFQYTLVSPNLIDGMLMLRYCSRRKIYRIGQILQEDRWPDTGPYSSRIIWFHGAQHALACLLHLEVRSGSVLETHWGNHVRLSPLLPQIFLPWHKETVKMSGNLKKVQVQQCIDHIYQRESKSRESKQYLVQRFMTLIRLRWLYVRTYRCKWAITNIKNRALPAWNFSSKQFSSFFSPS